MARQAARRGSRGSQTARKRSVPPRRRSRADGRGARWPAHIGHVWREHFGRPRSPRDFSRSLARSRSRNVEPPDASPTGLVSSSRSRLRTHLDVAQRSNCPSKIKNQFGYHAQDRRARREGRRRNEVPIDSGAPPSALQPATTRRSNSVGRWPRSGAGAEAENTRSCQGAGRFWNEDRLPPAEPGR